MWVRRRDCLRFLVFAAAPVFVILTLQGENADGFHDPRGGHIDQVSIDMGPPGVAVDVEENGKPAAGDRNFDLIPDAEGFGAKVCSWSFFGSPGDGVDDDGDTVADDGCPDSGVPSSGTPEQGLCGNGIDDDPSVGPIPPGTMTFDGAADDGCQVTLTPLEQCAEIIDDGILNADEDFLVGGQDRLSIDITVGAQPGPGGGIPADRRLKTSFIILDWEADVIDIDSFNPNFLILASGGGLLTVIAPPLPDLVPPFFAIADELGPMESGPGVIARLTIEGNGAGMANLLYEGGFDDFASVSITMDRILQARVAVSKDVNGDTVISGPKEIFRCCPAPAVGHVLARSHRQQACVPRGPRS